MRTITIIYSGEIMKIYLTLHGLRPERSRRSGCDNVVLPCPKIQRILEGNTEASHAPPPPNRGRVGARVQLYLMNQVFYKVQNNSLTGENQQGSIKGWTGSNLNRQER